MKNKKIALAMSGGVDSSVAALLLIQKGYEVEGFYLDITEDGESAQSVKDVAQSIGIPVQVVSARNIFQAELVDWMINEYTSMKTPNPCIHCNRTIKWGFLFRTASALGFQKIATGHYARILTNENKKPVLMAGVDKTKDQSYFLSYLSLEDLGHTCLPLGELYKSDVRKLASYHKLPNSEKEESQDLCFLKEDLNDFLKKKVSIYNNPGKIMDTAGNQLGDHEGLIYYTIGQRRGLHIAYQYPLYVIRKDYSANMLIVGGKNEAGSLGLIARKLNWLADIDMKNPLHAHVKIRSRSQPVCAKIEFQNKNEIKISFEKPVTDITPGQIAVIYKDEQVLGAGSIYKSIQ